MNLFRLHIKILRNFIDESENTFDRHHNVSNNKNPKTLFRNKSENLKSENDKSENDKTMIYAGLQRSNSYPRMGRLKSDREELVDFVTENLYNEFGKDKWENAFYKNSINDIKCFLKEDQAFIGPSRSQPKDNTQSLQTINQESSRSFIWSLWDSYPIAVSNLPIS